jgi:hypothetical protein
MPADLSSRSHIDTPAWQSFEMRMRARAAARRQAKRRRRRRLAYATAGAFALAFGAVGGALQLTSAGVTIAWPSPPAAPVTLSPASIGSLPLPADWDAPAEPIADVVSIQADAEATLPVNLPAVEPSMRESDVPSRRAESAVATPLTRQREAVAAPSPVSTSGTGAQAPGTGSQAPGTEAQAPPIASTTAASADRLLLPPSSEPPVEPLRSADPLPASRVTPPPAVAAPSIDPRQPIRGAIERYRSAYQRLDATAARAVWPAVDAAALARAFGSLSSQELSFDTCAIDVAGQIADATCTGRARVVPKIGGGSETVKRTWQFKLRQTGPSDWLIEKATVR